MKLYCASLPVQDTIAKGLVFFKQRLLKKDFSTQAVEPACRKSIPRKYIQVESGYFSVRQPARILYNDQHEESPDAIRLPRMRQDESEIHGTLPRLRRAGDYGGGDRFQSGGRLRGASRIP